MASISKDPGGRRRVLFVSPDGGRKSIRLGKVPQREAEVVKTKVEALLAANLSGCSWDAELSRWVSTRPDNMADKLAAVGLIPARNKATLGAFVERYIESRHVDTKPGTIDHLQRVQRDLTDHFGADKPLRDITPGDADEFRLFLIGKGLGENTVRRRCGRAKQFLTAAVRRKLVTSNPFADLKTAVQANTSRFYFVSGGDTAKVIEACPDAQWRLIVALSRYGGLRCPSEHLALRWVDVDWEHDLVTVRSPKTAHHVGGESRLIPMFPELRPYLEETFELAEVGTEFVITRYRDSNSNLRTQLLRIIDRAGLQPWPKPFQNMRSTRETELAETFPMHVVCKWIGNSQPVAAKHYLQVTDEHFRQAVEGKQDAAQNPAQYAPEPGRTEWESQNKTLAIPDEYEGLRYCTNVKAPRLGLEPRTKRLTEIPRLVRKTLPFPGNIHILHPQTTFASLFTPLQFFSGNSGIPRRGRRAKRYCTVLAFSDRARKKPPGSPPSTGRITTPPSPYRPPRRPRMGRPRQQAPGRARLCVPRGSGDPEHLSGNRASESHSRGRAGSYGASGRMPRYLGNSYGGTRWMGERPYSKCATRRRYSCSGDHVAWIERHSRRISSGVGSSGP
jgi:integrase